MQEPETIDRAHRYPTPFSVGSWLVPGFWLVVIVIALLLMLAG
jgi:hypothetical protein